MAFKEGGQMTIINNQQHRKLFLLNPSEAARLLCVSRMTVYRLCESGSLTSMRIGPGAKLIRITRDSVDKYLQEQGNQLLDNPFSNMGTDGVRP